MESVCDYGCCGPSGEYHTGEPKRAVVFVEFEADIERLLGNAGTSATFGTSLRKWENTGKEPAADSRRRVCRSASALNNQARPRGVYSLVVFLIRSPPAAVRHPL